MSKCSSRGKETLQSNTLQLVWNLQRQKWIRSDRPTVRTVTLYHSLSGECLPVPSVEELAKKKGVKMAQIAIAWSLKRVTAPIVGTTKLQNLKEMIGEINVAHEVPQSADQDCRGSRYRADGGRGEVLGRTVLAQCRPGSRLNRGGVCASIAGYRLCLKTTVIRTINQENRTMNTWMLNEHVVFVIASRVRTWVPKRQPPHNSILSSHNNRGTHKEMPVFDPTDVAWRKPAHPP
jgi:hypothetical protein